MTDEQMHQAVQNAVEDLRKDGPHWGRIEIEIGASGQAKYVNIVKSVSYDK